MSDKDAAHDPVALERVLGWLRQRDAEVERLQKALSNTAKGAEKQRQRDHHDVLCLVLEKLASSIARTASSTTGDYLDAEAEDHMNIARRYANLAYPPPKAEEPFDNARAVKEWEARNWAPKAEEP